MLIPTYLLIDPSFFPHSLLEATTSFCPPGRLPLYDCFSSSPSPILTVGMYGLVFLFQRLDVVAEPP